VNIVVKIGLVLVGLGAIAILLGTVKIKAKQELFSVGGFRATTSNQRTLPEARYVGMGMTALGGLVVVVGWRTRRGR